LGNDIVYQIAIIRNSRDAMVAKKTIGIESASLCMVGLDNAAVFFKIYRLIYLIFHMLLLSCWPWGI